MVKVGVGPSLKLPLHRGRSESSHVCDTATVLLRRVRTASAMASIASATIAVSGLPSSISNCAVKSPCDAWRTHATSLGVSDARNAIAAAPSLGAGRSTAIAPFFRGVAVTRTRNAGPRSTSTSPWTVWWESSARAIGFSSSVVLKSDHAGLPSQSLGDPRVRLLQAH